MYYVYILTNTHNTVLYTGVTRNLEQRLEQHQQGTATSFTKRYNLHKLVFAEEAPTAEEAIAREKQIKNWRRDKKEQLINHINPNWTDLLLSGCHPERSAAQSRDLHQDNGRSLHAAALQQPWSG
jgi:putative endonuclease